MIKQYEYKIWCKNHRMVITQLSFRSPKNIDKHITCQMIWKRYKIENHNPLLEGEQK